MKSGRLFTRTCCLLGFLLSTACGSRTEKASPDYAEFKMIVRLWPDHHKDSALREELLQALKKYPDFATKSGSAWNSRLSRKKRTKNPRGPWP